MPFLSVEHPCPSLMAACPHPGVPSGWERTPPPHSLLRGRLPASAAARGLGEDWAAAVRGTGPVSWALGRPTPRLSQHAGARDKPPPPPSHMLAGCSQEHTQGRNPQLPPASERKSPHVTACERWPETWVPLVPIPLPLGPQDPRDIPRGQHQNYRRPGREKAQPKKAEMLGSIILLPPTPVWHLGHRHLSCRRRVHGTGLP